MVYVDSHVLYNKLKSFATAAYTPPTPTTPTTNTIKKLILNMILMFCYSLAFSLNVESPYTPPTFYVYSMVLNIFADLFHASDINQNLYLLMTSDHLNQLINIFNCCDIYMSIVKHAQLYQIEVHHDNSKYPKLFFDIIDHQYKTPLDIIFNSVLAATVISSTIAPDNDISVSLIISSKYGQNRKGYGTDMMNSIKFLYPSTPIFLWCHGKNAGAIKFYTVNGFKIYTNMLSDKYKEYRNLCISSDERIVDYQCFVFKN